MDNILKVCDELEQILIKKSEKLNKIYEFTTLQKTAIEEQDDKRLHEYTDEKQKLIEGIDNLDKDFLGRFEAIKSELGIDTLDEIDSKKILPFKKIKDAININYQLIEKIFSVEKENNIKIKQEFDDIKGKIRQISGGKKITSAYEQKDTLSDGVFFDKKK